MSIFAPIFVSTEMCPTVIEGFFKERNNFAYVNFLQNQIVLFSQAILNTERDKATPSEVTKAVDNLLLKLKSREVSFMNSDLLKMVMKES